MSSTPPQPNASAQPPAWHSLSAPQVLQHLHTQADQGLAPDEAQRRLAQHGPNQLPQRRGRPAWLRLLQQFHNVLIYVMLASAVVTAALGHWLDTGVLLGAVVINAVIGFLQEGKAESALDAIRRMLSLQASVLRA